MWQEALFAASQIPLPAEDLDELSLALVEVLYEAKDYLDAATVHLDYRNDVPEAARVLCKGCYFGEAMRVVCIMVGPPDTYHSDINTDRETWKAGVTGERHRSWARRRVCSNFGVTCRL